MRIPYEKELQELWVSSRVDHYQREHRPHPDYSLFIAEFKTAIERIKADAFAEGCTAMFDVLEKTVDGALMLPDDFASIPNPYRDQ